MEPERVRVPHPVLNRLFNQGHGSHDFALLRPRLKERENVPYHCDITRPKRATTDWSVHAWLGQKKKDSWHRFELRAPGLQPDVLPLHYLEN